MSEQYTVTSRVNLSHKMHDQLVKHAFTLKIPMARLLAIAFENELKKETPFKELLVRLPSEKTEEYAYAEQAGKILRYMQKFKDASFGLDQFILLRHDIGVPDVNELLFGIREAIEKGFIKGHKPHMSKFIKTEYPVDYLQYRLKDQMRKEKKKIKSKSERYELLQKLKKEFKE